MVMPFADNRIKNSLASQMRMKRFSFFNLLIQKIAEPVTILDVGGTVSFWDNITGTTGKNLEVTILNRSKQIITREGFVSLQGDACNLTFRNQSFEVIFSNSVIEHVGNFKAQQRMAAEIRRVGKRYFIQTPNSSFPIEPHFLFPFFHWLPMRLRIWLVRHFDLGWMKRQTTEENAIKLIQSIHLLNKLELKQLFPEAFFFEEKVLGLTKSFIVYSGWD